MQDLDTCRAWAGLRVWLTGGQDGAGRQEGDIEQVAASFMSAGDVDVAVRLEDGRVEMVLGSQKGKRWDFVE